MKLSKDAKQRVEFIKAIQNIVEQSTINATCLKQAAESTAFNILCLIDGVAAENNYKPIRLSYLGSSPFNNMELHPGFNSDLDKLVAEYEKEQR